MIVERLARPLILTLAGTLRIRVRGHEALRSLRASGRSILYAFWHGEQFLLIPFHRNQQIGLMVSLSRDGERQARLTSSLGYVPFRGSSTRGAVAGLVGLIGHVRRGHDAGMAVDGPKGPLHEPKPGVLTLAYKTGAAVVPLRVRPSDCWRLKKTWDAYFIPKPFSRVTLDYFPHLELSGDPDRDLKNLKEALDAPVAPDAKET